MYSSFKPICNVCEEGRPVYICLLDQPLLLCGSCIMGAEFGMYVEIDKEDVTQYFVGISIGTAFISLVYVVDDAVAASVAMYLAYELEHYRDLIS